MIISMNILVSKMKLKKFNWVKHHFWYVESPYGTFSIIDETESIYVKTSYAPAPVSNILEMCDFDNVEEAMDYIEKMCHTWLMETYFETE